MDKMFKCKYGELRAKVDAEEMWFAVSDVCKMMGYKNPSESTRRFVEESNLRKFKDGNKMLLTINQSGLTQLFAKCKRPNKDQVQCWIQNYVIPALETPKIEVEFKELPQEDKPQPITAPDATVDLDLAAKMLNDPDFGIKIFSALKAEQEKTKKLTEENEVLKPKGEFFDTVNSSKDTISLGEAAKVLNMGIGRNLMCKLLRAEGIFTKTNLPIQRYILDGSFRVIEYPRKNGEEVFIQMETRVYQKGVNLIRETLKRVYEENEKEMK